MLAAFSDDHHIKDAFMKVSLGDIEKSDWIEFQRAHYFTILVMKIVLNYFFFN